MIAIPWYYTANSLNSFFNFSYSIATFLTLFWGLYCGTLIDRYSRQRIFLFSNTIKGLIVGSIAISGFVFGEVEYWMPFMVLATTFFGFNIYYPNLFAFVQQIVEPEYYKKTTAWIEIIGQTTNVFAGAIAAILLEGLNTEILGIQINLPQFEIHEIFAIDGLTYFIAFVLIAFISFENISERKVDKGTVWERIKTGFKYLFEHKEFFYFALFSYCLFCVVLVDVYSILSAYVKNFLQANATIFGIAELVFAGGALTAGILVGRYLQKIDIPYFITILIGLTGILFLGQFAVPSVILLFIKSAVFGFANSSARILRLTYILQNVPNHIIGRINSIFNMINVFVRSVFIMIFSFGFFHSSTNIKWAYLILGLFLLFCAYGLNRVRGKI